MLKLIYFSVLAILGFIFPAVALDISPNKVGVVLAVISEIASAYIILDKQFRKG